MSTIITLIYVTVCVFDMRGYQNLFNFDTRENVTLPLKATKAQQQRRLSAIAPTSGKN
jgi:hypothetical protein